MGFDKNSLELASYDVHDESPDVMTPTGTDVTGSCMVDSATSGGAAGIGMGAVAGAIATLLTGFPGLELGMIFGGGLTGAVVGGMAGIDRAVHDNPVNLPTIDEYESPLSPGKKLVVVRGSHEQVLEAREAISNLLQLRSHFYTVYGQHFHEHPIG